MDYDDPGWMPALRTSIPFLIVPVIGLNWMIRRAKVDGLTLLRAFLIKFVSTLFLFLVVLLFLDPEKGESAGWFPYLLIAIGLIELAFIRWARGRPLVTESVEKLAGVYRGSFFIGVGMAYSAALFGFVCFFINGRLWLYLVGMAFSLIGLTWIAPTRQDIERRQGQIEAQGTSLSLGKALMEVPLRS